MNTRFYLLYTRGISGNGGVGGWFGGGGRGLKGHRKSCFDGLKFFIKLTEKVKKRVPLCVCGDVKISMINWGAYIRMSARFGLAMT